MSSLSEEFQELKARAMILQGRHQSVQKDMDRWDREKATIEQEYASYQANTDQANPDQENELADRAETLNEQRQTIEARRDELNQDLQQFAKDKQAFEAKMAAQVDAPTSQHS